MCLRLLSSRASDTANHQSDPRGKREPDIEGFAQSEARNRFFLLRIHYPLRRGLAVVCRRSHKIHTAAGFFGGCPCESLHLKSLSYRRKNRYEGEMVSLR